MGACLMVGGVDQGAPLEDDRARVSAELCAVSLTATYN
jgi:hypothetical protein